MITVCGCWEDISENNVCVIKVCIIKFVHASRERNGDFDVCVCVCVCMCVFYMANDVAAVLIFVRTCKSKSSKYKDYMH